MVLSSYTVLGLHVDASATELKNRWRDLAKTSHPDNGGDVSDFRRYHEAYMTVLINIKKREAKLHPKKKGCLRCFGTGYYEERINNLTARFPCHCNEGST